MFQKVQPARSETQSGQTSPLGELPAVEAKHVCLPHDLDPQTQNGIPDASAGDCRIGGDVGRGRIASAGNCGFAARVLITMIRLYQRVLSPLCYGCCRFYPTCSSYAIEALLTHGFWRGCCLTVWRLLRCQPFCSGGWDPVPPRKECVSPCSTDVEAGASQFPQEQDEEK